MSNRQVMLITGTSRGIGKYLAHYYANKDFQIVGCSRTQVDYQLPNYHHVCLNIAQESEVQRMFLEIRQTFGSCDVLLNNAAFMATNYALLTPFKTAQEILNTNILGTFLFCREAAKLMQRRKFGRIVNFVSGSSPLKITGESIYAASKSAVITFTHILAKELGPLNITVNAVGPNPIDTDIISAIPPERIQQVINMQAIQRLGEFRDVANVIDFFIRPESDFVTGQIIFLGGI